MFFRRNPEPPQPDRLTVFRSVVNEAIRIATTDRESDWPLKISLAESLENFARTVRTDLAMHRPVY